MTSDADQCVRILTPIGRDAELALHGLRAQGLDAEAYGDVDSLCTAVARGVGAVLLTQEALALPQFQRLIRLLNAQPPWSDIPLVVLASAVSPNATLTQALHVLDEQTNSVLLERPVRMGTIVRAVASALRTRRRQYELRETLEARVSAERAERRARTEAEEALRAREEFLSIASHELRNPVAAIRGTAQLLSRAHLSGRLTDTRLATYIESIDSSGKHLAILTDDLLDVSRLQRGELPLRRLATDLANLVRDLARNRDWPDHRLQLEIEDEPLEMFIDPDRIGQVISNLLDNAAKYSPSGGDIRIQLSRDETGALLEVRDDGIGLHADTLESIFTPFGRAPNATRANLPGLGLGLYIARQIAEQHGGRLWAESLGEDRGTSMWLSLPMSQDGQM